MHLTDSKPITLILNKLILLVFLSCTLLYSCAGDNSSELKKKDKSELADKIKNKETKKKVSRTKKPMSLGRKVFIKCAACHNIKKGDPHKTGPNLNGLFGRKAGTLTDFKYSDALKNSDIIWDENHLREWLKKPMDYIPGTTMAFIGVKDEKQQTALIKYLKENTK